MERTLADLKPGDEIVHRSHTNLHGRRTWVRKIKRVTKTLIILDNDERFNRESGYESGASVWSSSHIEVPTDRGRADAAAYEKETERRNIINLIEKRDLYQYDIDTLTEVLMILHNADKKRLAEQEGK